MSGSPWHTQCGWLWRESRCPRRAARDTHTVAAQPAQWGGARQVPTWAVGQVGQFDVIEGHFQALTQHTLQSGVQCLHRHLPSTAGKVLHTTQTAQSACKQHKMHSLYVHNTDSTVCMHTTQTAQSACTQHKQHSRYAHNTNSTDSTVCMHTTQTAQSVCTQHKQHGLYAHNTNSTVCMHTTQTAWSVCTQHKQHSMYAHKINSSLNAHNTNRTVSVPATGKSTAHNTTII